MLALGLRRCDALPPSLVNERLLEHRCCNGYRVLQLGQHVLSGAKAIESREQECSNHAA